MQTINKSKLRLLWQAIEEVVGSQNKECCNNPVVFEHLGFPECCGNPITDADRIEIAFIRLMEEDQMSKRFNFRAMQYREFKMEHPIDCTATEKLTGTKYTITNYKDDSLEIEIITKDGSTLVPFDNFK